MKEKIIKTHREYQQMAENFLAVLAQYPAAVLAQQPAEGGWSPLQVAWHLVLVEEMSMAYVQKKMSHKPALKKAGLAEQWRSFLLWMYLHTPLKFNAPKGVGGDGTVFPDDLNLEMVSTRWRNATNTWTVFYAQMPDELADKAFYKHPRVGYLGWLHTIAFFRAHLKRHLHQVKRQLS